MKLLLTGATGFAGGQVLRQALDDPTIESVTVLKRRALGLEHPKLRQVLRDDFLDYSDLDLAGFGACVWCLGVSQSQVRQDAYVRITHDYALAAARALFAANPALRFCFLSGRGADPEERQRALYRRIKGRTERALGALAGKVYVFRPAYIRPTAISGPRQDIGRWLAPIGTVISWFGPGLSVDCEQLAACLLDVAKYGARETLFENLAIRNWGTPQANDARPGAAGGRRN
ncbi:epimerase [Burkholderia gladioli]|uniref:epimerase n=1 Tax=Burkholderia gladioli TaxID=28095 RepID=UPI00163ECBEF|nr:epimerase [Burkholderia gladioli]